MALNRTTITILVILCSLFCIGVCRVAVVEPYTVTSIKTKNGQVYNCIPFYKLLAFRHPSLKNEALKNIGAIKGRKHNDFGLEDSCPLGTLPILYGPEPSYPRRPPPPAPKDHCIAVIRTRRDPAKKFLGTRASLSLNKPKYVQNNQWSAGRMRLSNGLDSIEAGWMVNPTVFKDFETHLYVKSSAGGKVCINTQCPGFVQVDTRVPLGFIPTTYSQIGGVQWTWDITIEKHLDDGNWWFSIIASGEKISIGYWPKDLFTSLAEVASQVEWGGEIDDPGVQLPEPDMGSGLKADYNTDFSAFFYQVKIVNVELQSVDPDDTEKYEDCHPFYTTRDVGNQGGYWGRLMFYGGTHYKAP